MALNWMSKDAAQAVEDLDLSLRVRSVPEVETVLGKTVLFRGKKFRPALCFMVGQLFGIAPKNLQSYARAAEFVHAATLAHDDVIDESRVRRHRPTLNARVSNARAILAGDLLLGRVMVELAQLGQLKIIQDLSNTVEELVLGEWLQLEARKIAGIDRQHLESVAKKKTASLMIWCCRVPAHLTGSDPDFLALCEGLGESLGIAFQMIDDIIDYEVQGEKPFAQDIREGLVNFVTLEMIERNPSLRNAIERQLGQEETPPTWPWQSSELQAACDGVRARARAKLEMADQHLTTLSKRLESPNLEALRALRGVLVYLRERVR